MTNVGNLGALVSDLVAGTWALVTENEKGSSLAHRIRELKATLGAISVQLDKIADVNKEPKTAV